MTFRDQIGQLVYAHGGDAGTPEETIDVLQDMVRTYVRDLTINISEYARFKGTLDEDAVKLALRRDPSKLKQACVLFRAHRDVRESSSASLGKLEEFCTSEMNKKRKRRRKNKTGSGKK